MNIKLGLFRLWVGASIFWIAYCAYHYDLPCLLGFMIDEKHWYCKDPFANPFEVYLDIATMTFGPPITAAIIVSVVFWIVSGFRSPKISN